MTTRTPIPIRVDDPVRIQGAGNAPWRILHIDRATQTASLTRLGADPRSDRDGVPLKMLILAETNGA